MQQRTGNQCAYRILQKIHTRFGILLFSSDRGEHSKRRETNKHFHVCLHGNSCVDSCEKSLGSSDVVQIDCLRFGLRVIVNLEVSDNTHGSCSYVLSQLLAFLCCRHTNTFLQIWNSRIRRIRKWEKRFSRPIASYSYDMMTCANMDSSDAQGGCILVLNIAGTIYKS